jgi:hypothetical protein
MFIPDRGSKNRNKRQGWKKIFCQTIFCSHKLHKTQYYFIFDMLKKKIWPNFPRIIEVFTQKIVTKPSKIWVWDPGSGKNLFRIPDPGVKKAPDPGSGSATLTTAILKGWKSGLFVHFTLSISLLLDPDPHSQYGPDPGA